MLRTLRYRLIISHVLPLLVIVPLMGIALIYVLETRVMLTNLSKNVVEQAALIAELAQLDTTLWNDPAEAHRFTVRISEHLSERVMLLDPQGRIVASSDAADESRLGELVDTDAVRTAVSGQISTRTSYNPRLQADAVDVLVPVVSARAQVVGVVRLTHRLSSVYQEFSDLRLIVLGVLVAGLLVGALVGWVLAMDLEAVLHRVTRAIYNLASGQELKQIPEQGPEELRLLARAFNILVERLRTMEQTRHQLLANLVHELGRPLGGLHSGVQALEAGADDDEALRHELLAGMDEEIVRLRRLLNDLAGLHDRLLGPLELNRQEIAINDWLARLVSGWRKEAEEKRLHWEATIAPDLPVMRLDADRLGQAMGNLVSNAIKYTPPGGRVTLAAGCDGRYVYMRVSDTGPGITAEDRSRIFQPFFRGRTSSRFPQGMGLGLSIARDLVTAHGGRLEVDSTPGRGSDFTVWLPLTTPYDR